MIHRFGAHTKTGHATCFRGPARIPLFPGKRGIRPKNLVPEGLYQQLFLHFFQPVLEFPAAGNCLALGGNDCTQTTAQRPFIEVNLRFFTTHFFY